MRIQTEICLTAVDGALVAQNEGADRVEVCTALEVGGLTPSMALIEGVRQVFDGQVVVLVRPRPGDFVVTESELGVMIDDISRASDAGANGVAIGALTTAGEIDVDAMAHLMDAAKGMKVTFHRAIDSVVDGLGALPILRSLGVQRLLTSGGAVTAAEGAQRLAQMVEASSEGPSIVAASGIGSENVRALIEKSGVKEIHFSASRCIRSTMTGGGAWVLTDDANALDHMGTDPVEVAAIIQALRS